MQRANLNGRAQIVAGKLHTLVSSAPPNVRPASYANAYRMSAPLTNIANDAFIAAGRSPLLVVTLVVHATGPATSSSRDIGTSKELGRNLVRPHEHAAHRIGARQIRSAYIARPTRLLDRARAAAPTEPDNLQ